MRKLIAINFGCSRSVDPKGHHCEQNITEGLFCSDSIDSFFFANSSPVNFLGLGYSINKEGLVFIIGRFKGIGVSSYLYNLGRTAS